MNGQIQIETDSVWNPYASHENELEQLCQQLAAAQAEILRLREALAYYANGSHGKLNTAAKALAQPSGTSALESLVKRVSEMMRERCAVEASNRTDASFLGAVSNGIRKLPPITLEDLK